MPRSELSRGDMDMGRIALGDGAILRAPLDNEDTPALPSGALALHTPLGCFQSSSDSGDDPSGLPSHSSNCSGCWPPRRASGNPDAPPPQRRRTDSRRAQDEEDEEFRGRREFPSVNSPGSPELVTVGDVQRAARAPLLGWPSYDE